VKRKLMIGINGAGNIGGALTRHFTHLGHDVVVANSRGPDSLAGLAKETGGKPATVAKVPRGRSRGALRSFPLQAVVGMAAMVPDGEDAHTIAHNPKEEVIGEAFEVDPPEVGFEEVVSARTPGSVQHETAQFAFEVLGQLRVPGQLLIVHDLIYIGTNAPMKDELHDLRRRWLCESSSRRVIA